MRILAAFDKCKDSLSADDLCSLAKGRIEGRYREVSVETIPQTDGGEGFASILTCSKAGEMRSVSVSDSLGRPCEIQVGFLEIEKLNEEVTAFLSLPKSGTIALVEMASIVGLADLEAEQRNPWKTSTVGVGECLLECKEWGVSAILLGVGGSSTNDMGVGALSALGVKFLDELDEQVNFPCPQTWDAVKTIDASDLLSLPPIWIACDVSNPLLGENGATRQFGPQKGLKPEDEDVLENRMLEMNRSLVKCFPEADRKCDSSGMGAAGGIGFGLSLACDVSMMGGFSLVSKWFELEKKIKLCDLVVTGEGRFDCTSLQGKGPCEILRLAGKYGKKAILLAGSVEEEAVSRMKEECPSAEIHAFGRQDLSLAENLNRAEEFFQTKLDALMEGLGMSRAEGPVNVDQSEQEAKFRRIRRLKKWMRPLPRRSNVHRYPVLKWFSKTAYDRSYLWSFKGSAVVPTLFWGIWIAMLPIVGIQMLVAFFVALLVRGNLPLIVALQWISNPFTVPPIYFADYEIGLLILELFGINYVRNKLLTAEFDWSSLEIDDLWELIDTFPPMFVGGSIVGISLGVLAVFLYKGMAKLYKTPTTKR
jgi:glycerate kinase